MSGQLVIAGGCHCGALGYELSWPERAGERGHVQIPARRCSCAFCTRIDGVWTSHPEARLTIWETPGVPASRYRFATATADFMFCSRCGIMPLVTCEIDGRIHAVVNVNTFDDDAEGFALDFSDSCFDGESVDDRLGRRKARWIGRVSWKSREAAGP